jgi:hypothetical protein
MLTEQEKMTIKMLVKNRESEIAVVAAAVTVVFEGVDVPYGGLMG